MFDKKFIFTCVLLLFIAGEIHAQYFQFSQYNFTPQRINPAQVSTSDYATLSFDYRNQSTGGDFHLNSNIINMSYPLIARNGTRWSGIGLSLMDDRSGQASIFKTKEVGLSYAITIPVAKGQTLSLGFKGLYQSQKINLDGLYTGLQYIPDRGFDESISNGESLSGAIYNYITFSTGLYWQRVDKKGDKIAYWGISFFDFNKPEDSYLESTSQLNSTAVASLGFRLYHQGNISLLPELLYTRNSNRNVLNVGNILRYEIKPYPNQVSAHVDLITKYVIGRSGIIGLQFHKEIFSVGVSYDFPVIVTNVGNTGAFEVGLEFRKLVLPKGKKARQEQLKKQQEQAKKNTATKNQTKAVVKKPAPASDSSKTKPDVAKEDLSTRLKQKQDS
nr:PorP/SprF family type IX secretion system membrane protein [Chryseolinea sp.]